MRLHVGGHLSFYLPDKNANLDLALEAPTRLTDILAKLSIPGGEVVLVVVNGELAELSSVSVTNSDRVELFPPIGGGAE